MKIDYPRSGRSGARRFLPSWRQLLALGTLGLAMVVTASVLLYTFVEIPEVNADQTAQNTVVTFSDGTSEIGRVGASNRSTVTITKVPDHVQKAVLSAEDRDFYDHGGFSPIGIGRAVVNNASGSGGTQGGSTITQQLAKNLYLTQERTIERKVKELVISVKMENELSKDQILEDYLNTIYWGRSSYGVQAASEQYFAKDVSELTVSEGAALAAIIRSPGGYAPEDNLDRLTARWEYVLDGMVEQGWLTEQERAAQTFPTIAPKKPVGRATPLNGYLLQTAEKELEQLGFDREEIETGGLRVTTTFDAKQQTAAYAAIADQRAEENAEGVRYGLVSIDPKTGFVKALYGGDDYTTQAFNAATQAAPQAGSTFKPFTLAAALENDVTLRDTYNGRSPRSFEYEGVEDFKVDNFGGSSFGTVSVLKATANSVNTAYVDMNIEAGPEKTADVAKRAGITTEISKGPLNVLGTDSVTAYDMASAYGTFAAQGWHATPTTILEVKRGSEVLYKAEPEPEQVFEDDVMADLTYALQGVVTNGSGSRAKALGRDSAGKTGTASANKSAWYVGYTPQLVTAVTMFKEDANGNMVEMQGVGGLRQVTGGSFPVRIWTSYMKAALDGVDEADFPEPSAGATQAPRPSPTPTPTVKPPSPTPTPTPTPTPSPSSSPSGSPDPTGSGSASPSPVASSPSP